MGGEIKLIAKEKNGTRCKKWHCPGEDPSAENGQKPTFTGNLVKRGGTGLYGATKGTLTERIRSRVSQNCEAVLGEEAFG